MAGLAVRGPILPASGNNDELSAPRAPRAQSAPTPTASLPLGRQADLAPPLRGAAGPYCQRKSFSAPRKGITAQRARIRSCGRVAPSPAPSVTTSRRASLKAVSGNTRMIG